MPTDHVTEISAKAQKDRAGRVLIISHDAVFALDIEEMLSEAGIETMCFPRFDDSAASAIAAAGYSAAVVDLNFYRECSRLCACRAAWADVPVVVLGPGARHVRHHAFARDVRCLSKPVLAEDLLPLLTAASASTSLARRAS